GRPGGRRRGAPDSLRRSRTCTPVPARGPCIGERSRDGRWIDGLAAPPAAVTAASGRTAGGAGPAAAGHPGRPTAYPTVSEGRRQRAPVMRAARPPLGGPGRGPVQAPPGQMALVNFAPTGPATEPPPPPPSTTT